MIDPTRLRALLAELFPEVPCLACKGKRVDCPCCSTWTPWHRAGRYLAVCAGGWQAVQYIDIWRHNAHLQKLRA